MVLSASNVVRHRFRRQWSAIVLVVLGASVVLAVPATALDDIRDRIDEVEQDQQQTEGERGGVETQIDELSEDLDDTSADLIAADKRLRTTNAAVDKAKKELGAAEDELADAEDEADRIDTELVVAYANEENIEASLKQNAQDQQDSKEAVGAIARESYKNGGVGNLQMTLDVLAGEDDAVEEMAMARTVIRVQDQAIERLNIQQAQELAEQDRLAGIRREITMLLAQAEANVLRKAEARDQAQEFKREVQRLQKRQREDKEALEAEKASFEKELLQAEDEAAELEAELVALAQDKHGLEVEEAAEEQRVAREKARRLAEEQERARQEAAKEAARQDAQAPSRRDDAAPAPASPAQPAPPKSSGYLSAPSSAGTTSNFGYRLHPILGYQRLHAGIDYGGGCNSPVYAPADGTIIGTPSTSGGGNKIVIDHGVQRGVNLTTIYAHLSSYAVKSGRVSRGQVIAYVGNTGLSTACHLHFETRENGVPVDPRSWL